MAFITVGRWGKDLAVRFPGDIARTAGLVEGERVEIETRAGEVILRRAVPHVALEELFSGRSPEEWRAEYAGAYDWGPDLGRERAEE